MSHSQWKHAAAGAVAHRLGHCDPDMQVHLPGGQLHIRFRDGSVLHCVRRERPRRLIENGKIVCLLAGVYDGKESWCQPVALDPPY